MALNKTQQELIGNYLAQKPRVYDPIWQLFGQGNSPYLALSDKILVEEMIADLVKAGIIPRDSAIPSIAVDGHNQTAITPELIAGKEPLSALDTIAKTAAVAIINGQTVDNTKYVLDRKVARLKSGIGNTLGAMANELFFNGTFTTPKTSKLIDFGLDAATSVADTAIGNYTTYITKLVADFFANTGFVPRVMVGTGIQNKLVAEINASTGKKNQMDYKMVKVGDNGFKMVIESMNLEIEIFPLIKKYDDTVIDTSARIQLWAPETLLQAYAGLEFLGDDGQPKLLRSEVFVDKDHGNKETGRSSVFAKSAGIPFIINKDLIARYDVTGL